VERVSLDKPDLASGRQARPDRGEHLVQLMMQAGNAAGQSAILRASGLRLAVK
jgi:hypothetical protein